MDSTLSLCTCSLLMHTKMKKKIRSLNSRKDHHWISLALWAVAKQPYRFVNSLRVGTQLCSRQFLPSFQRRAGNSWSFKSMLETWRKIHKILRANALSVPWCRSPSMAQVLGDWGSWITSTGSQGPTKCGTWITINEYLVLKRMRFAK